MIGVLLSPAGWCACETRAAHHALRFLGIHGAHTLPLSPSLESGCVVLLLCCCGLSGASSGLGTPGVKHQGNTASLPSLALLLLRASPFFPHRRNIAVWCALFIRPLSCCSCSVTIGLAGLAHTSS